MPDAVEGHHINTACSQAMCNINSVCSAIGAQLQSGYLASATMRPAGMNPTSRPFPRQGSDPVQLPAELLELLTELDLILEVGLADHVGGSRRSWRVLCECAGGVMRQASPDSDLTIAIHWPTNGDASTEL
jgi:hypothetical protein